MLPSSVSQPLFATQIPVSLAATFAPFEIPEERSLVQGRSRKTLLIRGGSAVAPGAEPVDRNATEGVANGDTQKPKFFSTLSPCHGFKSFGDEITESPLHSLEKSALKDRLPLSFQSHGTMQHPERGNTQQIRSATLATTRPIMATPEGVDKQRKIGQRSVGVRGVVLTSDVLRQSQVGRSNRA